MLILQFKLAKNMQEKRERIFRRFWKAKTANCLSLTVVSRKTALNSLSCVQYSLSGWTDSRFTLVFSDFTRPLHRNWSLTGGYSSNLVDPRPQALCAIDPNCSFLQKSPNHQTDFPSDPPNRLTSAEIRLVCLQRMQSASSRMSGRVRLPELSGSSPLSERRKWVQWIYVSNSQLS